MSEELKLELRNVSKSFYTKRGKRTAVEDIQLRISSGAVVTLLGPTGCGKTTLLNIAGGFESPTAGEVFVDGVRTVSPGPDRGFMFQRPNLFPWLNVRENVAFPVHHGQTDDPSGMGKREVTERANSCLKSVGLEDAAELHPYELSGGMQSRAALARLLMVESPVLLMDEPFAALDAQTRLSMQRLLLQMVKDSGQRTILFITHDVEEALLISDHVYLMSAAPGQLVRHIQVPSGSRQVTDTDVQTLRQEVVDQLDGLAPQGNRDQAMHQDSHGARQ